MSTKSQTIFRVASRHKPYSQLGNSMLRDKRLSLEARGALGFILSHPADWRFSLEWLARETETGRGKTQRLVRELVDAGYCQRIQHRDERGRLSHVEYAFSDEPADSSPRDDFRPADTQHLVSPRDDLRSTVNPQAENRPVYTKKVSPKKVSDKIGKRAPPDLVSASPPTDDGKLPFSKTTIDELTALGVDVETLIDDYLARTAGKRIRDPSAYLYRMGLEVAAKRCGVSAEQMRSSNSKNRDERVAAAAGPPPRQSQALTDLFARVNARFSPKAQRTFQ